MTGMRLRPQTECAHGRADARGVERNKRIQQKWNVIARHIQIALIDLRHPGEFIEIFDDAAFRVIYDAAVLAKTHPRQFFERLAFGVIGDLVIELAAHDEIDSGIPQRLLRLNGHGWSDERYLQL